MKKFTKVIVAVLMLAFVSTNLKAQDITDADLKDYAIILMAQKSITDKISPMVNAQIAAQEGIDGKRYAELNKAAKGKIENLPADATDFEKQFYGIVQKRVDKKTKAAKTVVNALASNGIHRHRGHSESDRQHRNGKGLSRNHFAHATQTFHKNLASSLGAYCPHPAQAL